MSAGALLAALGLALATVEGPAAELARELERAEEAIERWDVAAAGAAAERVLARAPRQGEAWLLRARVRFLEGRYAEALGDLEEAARLSPAGETGEQAREFRAFVRPLAELAGRFTSEESEHFRVHFVDGPDRVLAARGLEALERCHARMAEDYGVLPAGKVRVEVFPDDDTFEKASTLTRDEIETSGTIALCKFNRLMMLSPRTVLRGFPWCDTLCHEYVHYVLWRRNGGTIPIWLHEGIAKYEEVRWTGAPGSELSPLLQQVLKEALEKGDFVTFDEMHPSFAKLKNPHDVALASAEVLSVIRLVMARGGYPLLARMLDALKDGADWRQMFERALDRPFEQFWAEWQAEQKRLLAGVRASEGPAGKLVELRGPDPPPASAGRAGAPAEGDDAPAKLAGRHARLGDLLRERGHVRAAALEYEKAARASTGRSPVLLNRLGHTWRDAGELDRALDAFRRAEALDPEYAPTLTNLGLLHRARGEAPEAIALLERAARVNPYDPRIHEALLEVYGALGRTAETQRARAELAALARPAAPPPPPPKEVTN